MERNFDADPALETLVHITVEVPATEEERFMMFDATRRDYLIWSKGERVVARTMLATKSCAVLGGFFKLRIEAVHHADFEDVVVERGDVAGCASWTKAIVDATHVWTIERGTLEEILTHERQMLVDAANTYAVVREEPSLRLVGPPPKRGELVGPGGKVRRVLRFDAKRFTYR